MLIRRYVPFPRKYMTEVNPLRIFIIPASSTVEMKKSGQANPSGLLNPH